VRDLGHHGHGRVGRRRAEEEAQRNPYPKRGAIKQGIIGEWFREKEPGDSGSDVDKGNEGDGDNGGTATAGYGG
jgi:hypothetical protein